MIENNIDTVMYIATRVCNMRCKGCIDLTRNVNMNNKKKNVYKYVYDFCKEVKAKHIIITGGEALMLNNICDIVKMHSELGITTSIITNGSFPEKIVELKEAGISNIFVSLDGLSQETHNVLKQTNVSTVLTTIQRIKELKIRCIINTIVHARNYLEIDKLINYAINVGVNDLFMAPFFSEKDGLYNELLLSKQQWRECKKVLRYWAHLYKHERYFKYWKALMEDSKQLPSKCEMLKKGIIIDENGNIFPCFSREDLICGNVCNRSDNYFNKMIECNYSKIKDAQCFNKHCVTLEFPFSS